MSIYICIYTTNKFDAGIYGIVSEIKICLITGLRILNNMGGKLEFKFYLKWRIS